MLTFTSFAPLLHPVVSPARYVILLLSAGVASGLAWRYDTSRRHPESSAPAISKSQGILGWFQHPSSWTGGQVRYEAQGASGIVCGVIAASAMLQPRAALPILLLQVGFDTFMLINMPDRLGIAHSAHLGGSAAGFVWYVTIGRKFGGLLGRQRFITP